MAQGFFSCLRSYYRKLSGAFGKPFTGLDIRARKALGWWLVCECVTNHVQEPSLRSPRLAYLCGVLAGDGSICVRPEKHEYVVYCSGNPADEREFYDEVVGPMVCDLFGIQPRMRELSGGTYGFRLYSKQLVEFLTQKVGLPVSPKHPDLVIPRVFFRSPLLVKNFVRGFFDTDGCVCFKKRYRDIPYYPVISAASRTKLFIRQLFEVLIALGFSPTCQLDVVRDDPRVQAGQTIIHYVELNGVSQLELWIQRIGFWNAKHVEKIAGEGFEPPASGL